MPRRIGRAALIDQEDEGGSPAVHGTATPGAIAVGISLPAATATGGVGHVFSDDFNRANGSLGSNWVFLGTDEIFVVSNRAECTFGTSGAWSRPTDAAAQNAIGADQYAELDVSVISGQLAGLLLRWNSNDTNYLGRVNDAAADVYEIYLRSGGTYTLLGSLTEAFPAPPFRIRFQIIGTALKLQLWNGSAWVDKVTASNATIADGAVGMQLQRINGSGPAVDNFACGNA